MKPVVLDTHEYRDDAYEKRALLRARKVQVNKNHLTNNFLLARDGCGSEGEREVLARWTTYESYCRKRHTWGEDLRSDLDWVWNPSSSFKRLFSTTDSVTGVSPAPHLSATAIAKGTQMNVSINSAHTDLPQRVEVQIAYKNKDGETKYETFLAISSAVQDDAIPPLPPTPSESTANSPSDLHDDAVGTDRETCSMKMLPPDMQDGCSQIVVEKTELTEKKCVMEETGGEHMASADAVVNPQLSGQRDIWVSEPKTTHTNLLIGYDDLELDLKIE